MSEQPQVGDTLVFERGVGYWDVMKMAKAGDWQPVRGSSLPNAHAAWEIARASLEPNGRQIWIQLASDTAPQPY